MYGLGARTQKAELPRDSGQSFCGSDPLKLSNNPRKAGQASVIGVFQVPIKRRIEWGDLSQKGYRYRIWLTTSSSLGSAAWVIARNIGVADIGSTRG
jgi:hypothetical protein